MKGIRQCQETTGIKWEKIIWCGGVDSLFAVRCITSDSMTRSCRKPVADSAYVLRFSAIQPRRLDQVIGST